VEAIVGGNRKVRDGPVQTPGFHHWIERGFFTGIERNGIHGAGQRKAAAAAAADAIGPKEGIGIKEVVVVAAAVVEVDTEAHGVVYWFQLLRVAMVETIANERLFAMTEIRQYAISNRLFAGRAKAAQQEDQDGSLFPEVFGRGTSARLYLAL